MSHSESKEDSLETSKENNLENNLEAAITYILEHYNQYTLAHFYKLSYRDGGLTMGQIITLHEHSAKRKNEYYKFLAAINGIDLDKENGNGNGNGNGNNELNIPNNDMTFRDPSDYEHMSDQEKEELTKKMMGGHMRAIQTSGFGG